MKEVFKVVVAGGRTFESSDHLETLEITLDRLLKRKLKTHKVIIISGKARGADTLGEVYARKRGLAVEEYPADWVQHGKSAGYIRNSEMCKASDAVCVFWDGKSKGSKNMIDITKKSGKLLHIEHY